MFFFQGGTSTVLSLLATFSAGSRATLLDHNALAPKLIEAVGPDFAANRAYGVVDHHADQGLYLEAVRVFRASRSDIIRSVRETPTFYLFIIFKQKSKRNLKKHPSKNAPRRPHL